MAASPPRAVRSSTSAGPPAPPASCPAATRSHLRAGVPRRPARARVRFASPCRGERLPGDRTRPAVLPARRVPVQAGHRRARPAQAGLDAPPAPPLRLQHLAADGRIAPRTPGQIPASAPGQPRPVRPARRTDLVLEAWRTALTSRSTLRSSMPVRFRPAVVGRHRARRRVLAVGEGYAVAFKIESHNQIAAWSAELNPVIPRSLRPFPGRWADIAGAAVITGAPPRTITGWLNRRDPSAAPSPSHEGACTACTGPCPPSCGPGAMTTPGASARVPSGG